MTHSRRGCIFLFFLSASALVFSQTATTSLRGTITDPSGALVPGATVTLTNAADGTSMSTTASSSGSYVFSQISPARYTITVSAPGFGRVVKSAELLVDQPATIDFKLSIQATAETVDVTSAAQTLNTSDATLGDSVGNSTIQALPMEGRDPLALLTLQPGVLYLGNPDENDTVDSRSGSVSGGRSDQGNITLDGMDDNDQLNGTAFTGVLRSTLDSTEEFRVTTSNGNADAGRSSGAQISLITKSGTNSFHGALYEYYRPTNTVANEWFNKYTQLYLGEPNVPQKYVMNTFGGTLGGPIKKDRLFFFFNYEGQRQAINEVVTRVLPTANFYDSELGYQDQNGNTQWLTASQVTQIDNTVNPGSGIPCTPSIGCGPDAAVISYYSALNAAGEYGFLNTVGDGVNSEGYVFSAPAPKTLNTSIGKIDYILTSKQHLFFRGNLQKDTGNLESSFSSAGCPGLVSTDTCGVENLPGQPLNTWSEDNTKGFAAGHTWTPTANIVNDIRYAFIRQGYSTRGIGTGQGDWVIFRFLDQPTGHALTSIVSVPVNNIVDNLTWTKGNHTLGFGGNWRGITNNRADDSNSYSSASTNPYWLYDAPNDPCVLTQSSSCDTDSPLVGSGFENSYEIAYDTLVGLVPQTTEQYNYTVSSPTSGTLEPDGAMISRHFRANEFEYYLQDAWRIKPNFTLTLGMRHSILQTPYESHGQQVSPTVDTHQWFLNRGAAAAAGELTAGNVTPAQLLSFAPSGKANHRPGYWAKQKDNIAPRFAAVWAPNARTSIRAGAGMYFDHFGEAIVNSFDEEGSFGLSNSTVSPASYYYVENSPRFTGAHQIPPLQGCPNPTATVTYPYTPAANLNCGLAITWGIDNHLKTPYAYAFDLSFQTELPGGFLFEEDYVGRLGRHLLTQLDLAEPVDLVDPNGGGSYFAAADELSRISDLHGGNPTSPVAPIQYFEDMFPFMANTDYTPESATQAIYSDLWTYYRYGAGETSALYDLDLYENPNGPQYDFWQPQFSSLYAWSSIGTSSYNALQVSLRHPANHGLTTDIAYTLSKSIDMGSEAEHSNEFSSDSIGSFSAIQNSWNPKLNKGVSDYDSRQLVTVDGVYALPVGRGNAIMSGANGVAQALLGGWQISGLSRWASPLPFSLAAPGWATNWQLEGFGVATRNVPVKKHIIDGAPQVFAGNEASVINNGIYYGDPVRLPYPGEAGERNNFRGDGYFDVDSALAKTWDLHESMKLKFDAEVYNVGNDVRFDDSPINLNPSLTSGTLGAYSGMLSTYRRMQFGLRIDY
ncbi:MAG TPA: TonB-dependent receptor [Terracidiphilus sp.]|nr:TonB-dependent receptor [Terracidiphilus sp.]